MGWWIKTARFEKMCHLIYEFDILNVQILEKQANRLK